MDPNEKTGPLGYGSAHVIEAGEELIYTVFFENLPSATAPAQEVFVTDVLHPYLDYRTFQPREIAFGDHVIPITQETLPFVAREVADPWWVDLEVTFDFPTGTATWTLRTIDPETGELPTDPMAGFLPPNDETGRGEGHVTFTVRSFANTPEGVRLVNQAEIVFDTEPPIATNEVFNTVKVTGDFDGDAHVTIDDFLILSDCLRGPGNGILTGCAGADFDVDEDVDIADFWQFQRLFGR